MNLAVHSADDTSTRTMDTQNSDFNLRSKNSEKKLEMQVGSTDGTRFQES